MTSLVLKILLELTEQFRVLVPKQLSPTTSYIPGSHYSLLKLLGKSRNHLCSTRPGPSRPLASGVIFHKQTIGLSMFYFVLTHWEGYFCHARLEGHSIAVRCLYPGFQSIHASQFVVLKFRYFLENDILNCSHGCCIACGRKTILSFEKLSSFWTICCALCWNKFGIKVS